MEKKISDFILLFARLFSEIL